MIKINLVMLFYSPMEGFILISILPGITNISLYLFIILLINLFISVSNITANSMIIQNNWQMIQESLFRTILSLIEVNLGKNYYQYLPLFYTIFLFIFLSNFLGVLPYTKTPSVELVITLSIATILLVGNLIIGIQNHSIYVLSVFLPAGCPVVLVPLMIVLECLAYVFRTISLGLRLAINIMTGKILCSVIIGFVQTMFESGFSLYILLLPLSFLTVYISLEILICYLQAYIFLFISCLTFKDLA